MLGAHQSGHNSGVVHAGLYYVPGSAKARLCREGKGLLESYCERRGIPITFTGKLVVALAEDEHRGEEVGEVAVGGLVVGRFRGGEFRSAGVGGEFRFAGDALLLLLLPPFEERQRRQRQRPG